MARVTIEDCLERVDNRFALVHLVAKRAKQLIKGSDPTIHRVKNKQVVTALREVASGLVEFEKKEDVQDSGDENPVALVGESLPRK